jgi:hypothetical protein
LKYWIAVRDENAVVAHSLQIAPAGGVSRYISDGVGKICFVVPWSHYIRLLSVADPRPECITSERHCKAAGRSGNSIARSPLIILENPPVGLILCSEKDVVVAHYSLGNLSN